MNKSNGNGGELLTKQKRHFYQEAKDMYEEGCKQYIFTVK